MQPFYIKPEWPAPPCVKAYTVLRYDHPERITAKTNPLLHQLPLPDEPIWIKQTHSTTVLKALPEHREQEADATFTHEANRICAVLTADCLPILICHRQGTHVAAIHAGWRGLADGIIEETINALQQSPEDLIAWFGPAIGPDRFAVKKEVYDAFTLPHPEAAEAFKNIGPEHWLADIYALARLRLCKLGITQIYGGSFCTYQDKERFFSFRRDGALAGRMVSLIWFD